MDQLTAPMRAMGKVMKGFGHEAVASATRAQRAFNGMMAPLSEFKSQLLGLISAAALAGAAIGGIFFSVNSIMDYEKALHSFRTIVSDLNDTEFSKYEKAIGDVANATRRSAVEVATSFEKIASLNAEFAKTPDAIAAVTKAAITLSKASGDELGVASENLVGIMNQFSLAATEADRAINVLAAGQAVGAASITQTSQAFVNFGSTASGLHISLEQSVALVQTLGKYSLFGAEAGTKLRGSLLKLQQAGLGYKSGQFQINDALADAKAKFDSLKTAKKQDAYLNKVFGAENISTGRILLTNIDLFKQFTAQVTGTNEAQKAAAINADTLSNRIDELKNTWVNLLTTSDKSKKSLEAVKNAIGWVTDNLDDIIYYGGLAIGIFVGFNAAMWAYNTVATVVTATQLLLDAAVMGFPVFWIVGAIAAVIAVGVLLYKNWDKIAAFAKNVWGGISKWFGKLKDDWNDLVTAITGGNIIDAFKSLGNLITDVILAPLNAALAIFNKLHPTDKKFVPATQTSLLNSFSDNYYNKIMRPFDNVFNASTSQGGGLDMVRLMAFGDRKEPLYAPLNRNEANNNTQKLEFDFKNVPELLAGLQVNGKPIAPANKDWHPGMMPTVTSTVGLGPWTR